jgi:hypothetical protein
MVYLWVNVILGINRDYLLKQRVINGNIFFLEERAEFLTIIQTNFGLQSVKLESILIT